MKKSYLLFVFVVAFLLSGCGNGSNTNEMNNETIDEMSDTTQPPAEQQGNESGLVKLPENYTDDVIYTTVDRGNAHETLCKSRNN